MKKSERNYLVDSIIGIAFLVAGISALVFLIPTDWIDFTVTTTPTFLGVNYGLWQQIHKWGGIAMLIGIATHQILHWDWIIAMTKKILPKPKLKKQEEPQASRS